MSPDVGRVSKPKVNPTQIDWVPPMPLLTTWPGSFSLYLFRDVNDLPDPFKTDLLG
jgi:hypothetical protein